MASEDGNFDAFSAPEVVEFYANYSGLQPAELYTFEKFVSQGASILDVGVGCGRTTPYLAPRASHYVGVDYVKSMIDVCIARFPKNTFHCVNATSLCMFEDATFDIVVFSFNGIDAIPTTQGRLRCLSEVFRVLRPGGLFIFSSHNSKMLLNLPLFDHKEPIRNVLRLGRAVIRTIPFAARLLSSGAFHAGAGYYVDPIHGGILNYCSTPELTELEVSSVGFLLCEVIHNLHPRKMPRYFIQSYYYVLAKPSATRSQRA
jgi:SAM-dependent methyltransferase